MILFHLNLISQDKIPISTLDLILFLLFLQPVEQMVDSQNSLWLAKYSIKVNSVPEDFTLSADIDALLSKPIQVHNFQKELEVSSTLVVMFCVQLAYLDCKSIRR